MTRVSCEQNQLPRVDLTGEKKRERNARWNTPQVVMLNRGRQSQPQGDKARTATIAVQKHGDPDPSLRPGWCAVPILAEPREVRKRSVSAVDGHASSRDRPDSSRLHRYFRGSRHASCAPLGAKTLHIDLETIWGEWVESVGGCVDRYLSACRELPERGTDTRHDGRGRDEPRAKRNAVRTAADR